MEWEVLGVYPQTPGVVKVIARRGNVVLHCEKVPEADVETLNFDARWSVSVLKAKAGL